MATAGTIPFTLALADRLATLEDLLARNPACAVGVCDPTRNIGDASPALAHVGIPAEGHLALQGGSIVEFLAVADAASLGDVALETSVHGSATRPVRLRDGQQADLHLIEIGDTEQTTIVVIVPCTGETVTGTPPPTAVAASPRLGDLRCDAFGIITNASASTLELLGRPNQPIDGSPVISMLHADDQEMAIVNWSAAKEQRGDALRWRCRVTKADGSPLWVEATITNTIGPDGAGDVRIELYDISREVAATDALLAERELIGLLTETLPVGVAKFDAQGLVEHANGRLAELLAPIDPQELLAQAMLGGLPDEHLAAAFAALLQDGTTAHLVVDHVGTDGSVHHLEWTLRAAFGDDGTVTGGVVCIADVSESSRLREALERRARTDALTDCLNRAGTLAALERALTDLAPSAGVGVLFIDLDHFKSINDTLGHAVGDAVLEVVASRLRGASRSGDLVGRLGGDEFVVIALGLPSGSETLAFADRVALQLQGPTTIDGITVQVAASIGVAWSSACTASDLLNKADAAMYIAKQAGSAVPILSMLPVSAA
jgi:diguanylate cyclase (GGDEF)-like protein